MHETFDKTTGVLVCALCKVDNGVCVCLSPAAGFDDFGTVLAAAAATPRPPQRPTPSAAADSDGEAAHTLYLYVYIWSGGNTHAALHKADCGRLTCVH